MFVKKEYPLKNTVISELIMYIGKVDRYRFGRSLTAKGSNGVYSTGKR